LESVEWGEFKYKNIFNKIVQGRRLKKDDQISGDIPFVMAGITNAGVVNYISNPVANFPKNSITVDIFGNVFYRDYDFGAGDDTGVYWNTEKEYSKETMLFFAISMESSLLGKFSFGKKLRSSQSLDFKIQLPIKDGKIDFEFMESFIAELEAERLAELEAERLAELEAYLLATGLKDYALTSEEQQALDDFENVKWQAFNLEKLFGKSTRGRRLKSDDRIAGDLPFVTAGETDEGISAFIGNNVTVYSENTTTIDMFGSAKYRNYQYGGDDHIAVVHTENLPKFASIFVTTAIHKTSYAGLFSYSRNFYAKDADELNILLPTQNHQPNYAIMQTFISAIQKLVIKDVVLYTDSKIEATNKIVAN
jgi:Type I restriction modification DNA specificity domain